MAWFKRQDKGIQTATEDKKDTPKGLWYKTPSGKIIDTEELKAMLPHRYPFLMIDKIIEFRTGNFLVDFERLFRYKRQATKTYVIECFIVQIIVFIVRPVHCYLNLYIGRVTNKFSNQSVILHGILAYP